MAFYLQKDDCTFFKFKWDILQDRLCSGPQADHNKIKRIKIVLTVFLYYEALK